MTIRQIREAHASEGYQQLDLDYMMDPSLDNTKWLEVYINWYVSAVLCVLFCVAGPCCSVALGALCWHLLLWVFFESLILTIKLLCNAVTTKYGRQVIE
eukprot:scaffold6511_cov164-Skeletonema_dohrnii-CCMP3373.AAC.6